MKKLLLFLLLAIFFSNFSNAKITSREELISSLAKIKNEKSYKKMTDTYSMFSINQKQVLKNHFKIMYKDNSFITYLVDEMISAGLNDSNHPLYKNKNSKEVGQEFGAAIASSLAMSGISRLDSESQLYYLKTLHWMLDSSILDPKLCAEMMYPERHSRSARELQMIEMRLLSKMDIASLERWFIFLRRSMYAEIKDSPIRRTVGTTEIEFAEHAYNTKLEKMFERHPKAERVLAAAIDETSTDDYATCEIAKISVQAILELDGNVQNWFMVYFLNQLK